jgi:CelD/BcsL family acetyltransferase involved in cellulose biosynthesis
VSGQRRKVTRKRLRALREEGRVELAVAHTAGELEATLDEAVRVHRARWRDLPDRSGFATQRGVAFHRDAAAALATLGVPRIATLRLDGRLIAYYYWLALGDRVCGADMAYDPAFARWSPGWLATLHMLETAAADGAREIEFLGGLEEYKLVFANDFRPTHEAFAAPRTAAARAYVAARSESLRLRRRLKSVEPVRRFYYDGLAPARRAVARLRRSSTTEV